MVDTTKGKHANIKLITGDPKKAINKLAWPMMLSMLLIMLYNLADSVWVSGLGADALAALGFITPLFMIIVGLGNGIGAGANSLIARAFGAKKDELVNNAALHSVILTIIIGIVIPIILLPLIPQIIVFLFVDKNLLSNNKYYLLIYFLPKDYIKKYLFVFFY